MYETLCVLDYILNTKIKNKIRPLQKNFVDLLVNVTWTFHIGESLQGQSYRRNQYDLEISNDQET